MAIRTLFHIAIRDACGPRDVWAEKSNSLVGDWLANGCPMVGQWLALANVWSMVEQWLANVWPTFVQWLANGYGWPNVGQWLANGGPMASQWLANGWPMVGQWSYRVIQYTCMCNIMRRSTESSMIANNMRARLS